MTDEAKLPPEDIKLWTPEQLLAEEASINAAIRQRYQEISEFEVNLAELSDEARRRVPVKPGDIVETSSGLRFQFSRFLYRPDISCWLSLKPSRLSNHMEARAVTKSVEWYIVGCYVHKQLKGGGWAQRESYISKPWRVVQPTGLTDPEKDGDERLRITS